MLPGQKVYGCIGKLTVRLVQIQMKKKCLLHEELVKNRNTNHYIILDGCEKWNTE